MWNNLLRLLKHPEEKQQITGDEAIATILVRAAKTDGVYSNSEKTLIEKLLITQMNVPKDKVSALQLTAEALEKEINDNVQLTRVIKKEIEYEDRKELIKQLWQIIMDDDMRTPEENKLMRVLTHLLGVSDVESAKARSKALSLVEKRTE